MPRTFKLPEELDAWSDWVQEHPDLVSTRHSLIPGATASRTGRPVAPPTVCASAHQGSQTAATRALGWHRMGGALSGGGVQAGGRAGACPAAWSQDTGLWMLKNNKQRGTGLRLVPTREAFDACFETTTRPGLEGMLLYRW